MKLIVPEPGRATVLRTWLAAERNVSSIMLYPEARAAVGRAARQGRLPRGANASGILDRLWADVERVPVTEPLALRAGELAERVELRGYDAVHLASLEQFADDDPVLLSTDVDLLRAARSLGFATVPLD